MLLEFFHSPFLNIAGAKAPIHMYLAPVLARPYLVNASTSTYHEMEQARPLLGLGYSDVPVTLGKLHRSIYRLQVSPID